MTSTKQISENQIPVIEVEARAETGKTANKRYRAGGFIPTVVYHRHEESANGLLSTKEFTRVASQSKSSQIFALKSKDARFDGKTAIVKEVKKDFLKNRILHVDIMTIKDNEEINVRVPVRVIGDAFGVKNEGGILSVAQHDLGVVCLPRAIPKEIVIDVTDLHLGKSISAGAIKLPDGVTLTDSDHETIVGVVSVRATVEEAAPAAADAAAPAAAAAAPAAGKAAAAPAKAAPAAAAKKDKK